MSAGAERTASWAAAVAALIAFAVGLGLPDLDQVVPLGHRSALTHSLLLTLMLLGRVEWRPLAGGVGFGSGVHLSADAFPNAMVGYATIKLPLSGSIGAMPSYLWLVCNALAALAIGALVLGQLFPRRIGLAVFAAIAVCAVAYLAATDGGWPPLGIGAGAGALWWRRQRSTTNV